MSDLIAQAVSARPDYLPALTNDSLIKNIQQRMTGMPILSLMDDVFTLLEGDKVLHEFKDEDGEFVDETMMYFLHIHYFTQRRAFEGQWEEDDPQDPICQSDGEDIPMEGMPDIQADNCQKCWRSDKDTKRSDRCSYFRNAIVWLQYRDESSGNLISTYARLRLNGGTLYGEEDRAAGSYNGESLIRVFSETLSAELWYHPVVAYFDTKTKGAKSKLNFEVVLTEYPPQELAEAFQSELKSSEFISITNLRVPRSDDEENEDDGGDESTETTQREASKPRQTKKASSSRSKKKAAAKTQKAAADPADDDSSGSDAPTGRNNSRRGQAKPRGARAAKAADSGRSGEAESGRGGEREGDERGDTNPLADESVMDMIGDVELP